MKIYAVIDGSHAKDLLTRLSDYPLRYSCLYNEPIQEDLRAFSPYLVELSEASEDPFKKWLKTLGEGGAPWGLYLFSKSDFQKLRQHLRKYTYAKIPTEEKPVMFRYYDPRVFWKVIDILEDSQLYKLLEPIQIVSSYYQGKYLEDHFSHRRKNGANLRAYSPLLSLSIHQYEILNQSYQDDYIKELRDYMLTRLPDNFLIQDNCSEEMHLNMLVHERDVKGADITHSVDLALLGDIEMNDAFRFSLSADAYYMIDSKDREWKLYKNNCIYKVRSEFQNVLRQLNCLRISEVDFHRVTHYVYFELAQKDAEKLFQEERYSSAVISYDYYRPKTLEELKKKLLDLAKEINQFCLTQGITDDRYIKGLASLFVRDEILEFRQMPSEWYQALKKNSDSGEYRSKILLFKEFGTLRLE